MEKVSGIDNKMPGIKDKMDRLVVLTLVRLVDERGRGNSRSGRLEVRHNGEWGTVCDDDDSGANKQENNNVAEVVCRALNGGDAGGTVQNGGDHSNYGGGKIWLDNLQCTGNEISLFDCSGISPANNCGHDEDLAVIC